MVPLKTMTCWASREGSVLMSRFNQFMAMIDRSDAGEDRRHRVYDLLVDLRRHIAGDGPHTRPEGSLEKFDQACDEMGIPFLEP